MRYLLAWDVPISRNGVNQRPYLTQYLQRIESQGIIRGIDISFRCQPQYFHVNLELLDEAQFGTLGQALQNQFSAILKHFRQTIDPENYIY